MAEGLATSVSARWMMLAARAARKGSATPRLIATGGLVWILCAFRQWERPFAHGAQLHFLPGAGGACDRYTGGPPRGTAGATPGL